jgi:FKBP-type peptidyl-prolyl cis-trans isomerase
LGKFNVLPGLDLAVRTMQRRERAKFIISSDLLYGEHGLLIEYFQIYKLNF